jgi:hypothetical protein
METARRAVPRGRLRLIPIGPLYPGRAEAYTPSVRPFSLVLPLTVAEREAIDRLKAAAALPNDADLARLAVWRLAEHYDLRLPLALFAVGTRHPARRNPAKSRAK